MSLEFDCIMVMLLIFMAVFSWKNDGQVLYGTNDPTQGVGVPNFQQIQIVVLT